MDPNTEVVPSNLAIHLRNYSIELNPREPKAIAAAPERLDPGTEVYLTWVPGADPMDVVAAVLILAPRRTHPRASHRRPSYRERLAT